MDKHRWAIGTLLSLTLFYFADSRLFSQIFPGELIPNNYQFKLFRRETYQPKPNVNRKHKEVNRKRG